jgi:hypothetical protein
MDGPAPGHCQHGCPHLLSCADLAIALVPVPSSLFANEKACSLIVSSGHRRAIGRSISGSRLTLGPSDLHTTGLT